MTRMMTSLTVAFTLSGAMALHAQEVKSRTTVKADKATTVTYISHQSSVISRG